MFNRLTKIAFDLLSDNKILLGLIEGANVPYVV